MSYTNVYPSRINWENEPSIASPINATNLNKIDYAVYEHDQTFETWDVTKANQSDLLLSVKSIDYNTSTGVFVFTWQNGTTKTVDLNIEKIPVSFSMSAQGVITMTTEDGTQYTADVGSLIKTYTFTDSTEIDFTVTTDASGNKTVTAALKDGSIVGTKLEPNYLANCQSAANSASASKTAAEGSAEDAEAWAVGERDGVPVPSTDPAYENNAKWYAEHGTGSSLAGLSDVDINTPTDGQVLTYNGTSTKWENSDPSAGGGSTVKITTTETTLKGKNVTITQGTTVLTSTFDNSGVAEFTGVTLTGNVAVSASDGTQSTTKVFSIPYFGNYTFMVTFFSATITVTFPYSSGATCTLSDGLTTLTADTSPMAFTVPNTGTWTATATLDGVSAPTQSKVITTDGQTESITIEFGTINLTYSDEFRGATITCSLSGTTITKTAPSSGNTMYFYPPSTGTWSISGTYSGTTYTTSATVTSLSTPVPAELQTTISQSVTVYGAKEDTISYTDIYGNTQTIAFGSGQTSKTVNITIMPGGSSFTFTSSVAKNPNNLSQNFSKTVSITSETSYIDMMPVARGRVLYWYGYVGSNCEEISTTNGWVWTGGSFVSPTYNKNSITCTSQASKISGIGSKTAISGTGYAIAKGITALNSTYGNLISYSVKDMAQYASNTDITSNAITKYSNASLSSKYLCVESSGARSCEFYAFWYE